MFREARGSMVAPIRAPAHGFIFELAFSSAITGLLVLVSARNGKFCLLQIVLQPSAVHNVMMMLLGRL